MNEIITKSETMTEKQLLNNIVKACDSVKVKSYELCVMINRLYKANPSKDTTDLLIERTSLTKSTITQMKKAGGFFIENPSLNFLDYSKAYLLSSLEAGELVKLDNEELKSMSQRDVKNFVKSCTEVVDDEDEFNVDGVMLYPLGETVNNITNGILNKFVDYIEEKSLKYEDMVEADCIKNLVTIVMSEILGGGC